MVIGTATDAKVDALRAQLPAVQTTGYFNTGSNGPIPIVAYEAADATARRELGSDDRRPEPAVAGWAGYFGFSQLHELASLDGWIRRRLRCVIWVQWKTRGRRYKELRRLKVSEKVASAAIFSPKGPWRLSSASALHRAFTNKRFKGLGLVSMETLVGA